MKVNIKRLHPNAVIPSYANDGDACFDLTAVSREWNSIYEFWEYGTGWAFEVPEGYKGICKPRSSISKYDIYLTNSLGTIDEPYRGEVRFRFKMIGNKDPFGSKIYEVGDKIGQMEFERYYKVDKFEVVETLSDTVRGTGGFGSSGK